MLDLIQILSKSSNANIYGLSALNSCSCSLDSGAFDMVLESLLKAMNEQNKTAKYEEDKISLDNILNNFSNKKLDTENLNVDERIENAVNMYSNKYGVDGSLINAIIKVESNFDPSVVSSAGAQGLMQIMPENCTSLGISDPFDIEQNIEGGVKLIKQYIDMYDGNIEMALMAYNGGPTRMINRGVTSIEDIYKMPKETQNYVPKVMEYYRG